MYVGGASRGTPSPEGSEREEDEWAAEGGEDGGRTGEGAEEGTLGAGKCEAGGGGTTTGGGARGTRVFCCGEDRRGCRLMESRVGGASFGDGVFEGKVKSAWGKRSSYLGGASAGREEYLGGPGVRGGLLSISGDSCCGKV